MQNYPEHVSAKAEIFHAALQAGGYDQAIVSAGSLIYPFGDDLDYPFRCNPYFSEWLPVQDRPDSYLLVSPGRKAELIVPANAGFWDSPPRSDTRVCSA